MLSKTKTKIHIENKRDSLTLMGAKLTFFQVYIPDFFQF